ncbi:hypothetical protein SAMN02745857_03061 [Andreprevotia lacus DSM 23236]|jgi:hypothetical protein|uniref:Uncharacterized protein n=1 Tax=Andreprevotia lacus DSM 23236 TaxID=1121001 RepID=A0A1W1XVR1_9NEIS|nr:hypothetical protein [Andreprevotia lacus]SMC27967.1 hypothetical protein SAMN02745857_03061 [Andreprevotia lacus DSM 23236]
MHRFALSLLLAAAPIITHAKQAGFSYQGYTLGMSKAAAAKVDPKLRWQTANAGTNGEVTRLQFRVMYLDRPADAYVDLDAAKRVVQRIGFNFSTTTDFDCLAHSALASQQLEQQYGPASSSVNEPPRKMHWVGNPGYALHWVEVCSLGAKQYSVVFQQP